MRIGTRVHVGTAWGLALTAIMSTSGPVHGQGHTSSRPDSVRHIQTVVPRSGPPGTLVQVATLNLPLEARVHVGLGSTDSGFESLAEVQQDELGAMEAAVTIPQRTTWDQAVVFIAFNGIFAPIGRSEPFHVTDERGWIQRTGALRSQGAAAESTCLLFRDRDGFDYALDGNVESLTADGEFVVEGRYLETSVCGDVVDMIDVAAVRQPSTP